MSVSISVYRRGDWIINIENLSEGIRTYKL